MGIVSECVDLAPGLTEALYFEYLKNIYIFFLKCTLSIQSTNPKYVIFNSTQKRQNYRSTCVNSMPQILSDFVSFL
jgi:hypothetical protein